MSSENNSKTTRNELVKLITSQGVYHGSKVLEIVKKLNQEAVSDNYVKDVSPILKNLNYSEEFRSTLIKFLKRLKVIRHDKEKDVWYVASVEKAGYLLDPAFILIAHNELRQEWRVSNIVRRQRKKQENLEEENRVQAAEIIRLKTALEKEKSKGVMRGSDLPQTLPELENFVRSVVNKVITEKKQ